MSKVMDEHDERVREEKRREMIKTLKPGDVVRVIERFTTGPSYKPYRITRLSTWKQPNSDGIKLARDWSKRQHNEDFKVAFAKAKGPLIQLDCTAFVVAVIPSMPDDLSPDRPWVLLMTDDGCLGWCYAIDGLQIVKDGR